MSFKDLYSEVKKRKMQALNKKDVVKAVEKHGKILAVDGKFEKVKKVIKHIYASEKEIIKTRNLKDILKTDLNRFDVVLLGCPGNNIPRAAHPKIKRYVEQGGWLITTDWVIKSIIEPVFPGYIRWNGNRSDDTVVSCQILEPNHPFLDGVISEISKSKWQESAKDVKKKEFKWWLENRSFPIQVVNHQAVRVLIASWELKNKYGEAPVLVYFDYGKQGGRIIHMISHTHLQKGGEKGKYASALILTNILDEKVARKMGISKGQPAKPAQRYQDPSSPNQNQNYVTPQMPPAQSNPPSNQSAFEENWVFSSQNQSDQNDYVTPDNIGSEGGKGAEGVDLTGTSKIVETDVNDPSFSFADECAYCGYDFGEYQGKVFTCNECGTHYHENCINQQVQEGVCKKCGRILLW
ncbi:MAG: hypothetical protein R6U96_16945 [Promethearchaeia archaeon]